MLRLLSIGFISFWSVSLHAADWPCWRGPDSLGVSSEKNLPTVWGPDKNLAWKFPIPGKGASSPIVVGNRVYLTSQTDDTALHLLAVDRINGKLIWDQEIGRGRLKSHNLHNMATPTAVSDGQHIWVMFGTGDLACLDAQGKIIWQRNLVKEYGEYKTNHGYGSSPMLWDGRLYIACMHQGPSYLLALDARTGTNIWKRDRNLDSQDEAQDSYSSPLFLRQERQVVLAGAEKVTAYDAASGEQQWVIGGLKVSHPFGRTIAGPTAGEGKVIAVTSGFQNRGSTIALKTGGKGDVSKTHQFWTSARFSPDCPTPLIYQGKLFSIRDDGMASCLDLKTGEPHWQERLFSGDVKVSPVAGDGMVYFTSGKAITIVVKASPRLEVISTNQFNESTLSTPAISGGRIFMRTDGHLFCIGTVKE